MTFVCEDWKFPIISSVKYGFWMSQFPIISIENNPCGTYFPQFILTFLKISLKNLCAMKLRHHATSISYALLPHSSGGEAACQSLGDQVVI